MAGEDEIIQKWRIVDAGAVQTLTNIDKQIQATRTSTASLNTTVQEHGGQITKLGEKMVGLGERHMNARHAVMLFSEATGVGRGGIMTLMRSMMMMGPVVGAAIGGFILFKQAMDAEAEAAQKSAEKHKELAEAVQEFNNKRKESAKVFEFGKEGAEAGKEEAAARKVIDDNNRRIQELTTTPSDPRKMGFLRTAMDWWGLPGVSGTKKDLEHGDPAALREKQALEEENTRIAQVQKLAEAEKERHKKYQAELLPAQDSVAAAERKIAEGRGLDLKASQEMIDAHDKLIRSLKRLEATEKEAPEKRKLHVELEKEEVEQIKRRNEQKDKEYERKIKLANIINAPGVFATPRQKAESAENKSYDAEKHEAERIGGDVEAITRRHNDRMTQIANEEKSATNTRRAAIDALVLQNKGQHYQAELGRAEAHWKSERASHEGNVDAQKLDDDMYAAEKDKIMQDHINQNVNNLERMNVETLRLKGDNFEAEREQLKNELKAQLKLHADQADDIKALKKLKGEDIDRRQSEDRTKVLGGYHAELISATMGSGAGRLDRMQQEHEAKQAEYKRTGETDKAQAENAAYQAQIHRMKIESDAKQQGHVGFMEAGSAWDTFAASLNKNPMEAMHLQEEKTTNAILTRMDAKMGGHVEVVG